MSTPTPTPAKTRHPARKAHSKAALARIMAERHLTVAQIAASYGCTPANVRYFLSHGIGDRAKLVKMASVLGVEPDALAGGPLDDGGLDQWWTPPWVTRALIAKVGAHFNRAQPILEPCAGLGRMAQTLQEQGFAVVCGDVDRAYKPHRVWDFVAWSKANAALPHPERFPLIVTCPPHRVHHDGRRWTALDFVEAALSCADVVALLLRADALEPSVELAARRIPAPQLRLDLPRPALESPVGEVQRPDDKAFSWFVWFLPGKLTSILGDQGGWPTRTGSVSPDEAARLGMGLHKQARDRLKDTGTL